MDDLQFDRYSRHMMLPQFGRAGQMKLLQSRVLVVGMGGLGSPVTMYLASSGVGHLVLADFDVVELSNLQRQIIHGNDDLGRLKVESAKASIAALNPDVRVTTLARVLSDSELTEQVAMADVVVDASDNFETRFALNAASVATGTALVSGAAQRLEGQVSVYQPALADSPCYHCLYSDDDVEAEACADTGVFAPLLGIVGSVQAAETLKLLIGAGQTLTGQVLVVDALYMEFRTLKLNKDPRCSVCGQHNSGHTRSA